MEKYRSKISHCPWAYKLKKEGEGLRNLNWFMEGFLQGHLGGMLPEEKHLWENQNNGESHSG
jgi:hypothetical protein